MKSAHTEPVPQAGAICRVGQKVVLVTNSGGNRWVIPKGHMETGDPNAAFRAEEESWEEAGVQGQCQSEALGEFFYFKRGRDYKVTVFLMDSCTLAETWPESTKRTRVLVAPEKAADLVNEPGLKKLFQGLCKRVS